MKKCQLAAQLYTLRDFMKTPFDVAGSLETVKKIGYDAVQASGSVGVSAEEFANLCKKFDLKIIATHEPSGDIFDEPDKAIAHLKTLNCKNTAYPWPHVRPFTHTGAVLFAKKLNELAEKFAANGCELSYHNHDIEFARLDGELILDIIYREAPALKAELDVFWVAAGGQDPVKWINKLAGRQTLLHLKEYGINNTKGGREMRAIGDGNLDWDAIISAGEKAGVQYFIVEQDECNGQSPFSELARSYKFISERYFK
jgi:sugar phosphate isomerase/epimerase